MMVAGVTYYPNTSATDITDYSRTSGTWYTIEASDDKEPLLPFFEKSMRLVSGKIHQLWVNHYNRHILWNAIPVIHKTGLLTDKRFRRRFQGFNRGRHWDRKAR